MSRQHKHFCDCGEYRTCSRPDCLVIGWECDDCADERRTLFLLSREYDRDRITEPEPEQRSLLEAI